MRMPPPVPPVGAILAARHAFAARSDDELTFGRHDLIQVLETDANFNDSWFLGRHLATGHVGLFPNTYMEPAPVHTSPPPAYSPTTSANPNVHAAKGSDNNRTRYRKQRNEEAAAGGRGGGGVPNHALHPIDTTTSTGIQSIPASSSVPIMPPPSAGTADSSPRPFQHMSVGKSPAPSSPSPHPSAYPSPIHLASRVLIGNSSTTANAGVGPLRKSSNTNRSDGTVDDISELDPDAGRETSSAVNRTIRDIDHHLNNFQSPPRVGSRSHLRPESRGNLASLMIRSHSASSSDYGSEMAVPSSHAGDHNDHNTIAHLPSQLQDRTEDQAEASDELTDITFSRHPPAPLTREVVSRWTSTQVAAHLRSMHISADHAEVFRQQEISGDVLLSLDRDTLLHPTLLDLGVAGSRLKIWNAIRDFRYQLDASTAAAETAAAGIHFGNDPHLARSVDDSYVRLSHHGDLGALEYSHPGRPLSGSFAFPTSRLSQSSSNLNYHHLSPNSVPATPGSHNHLGHHSQHSHHSHLSHSSLRPHSLSHDQSYLVGGGYNRHSLYGSPSASTTSANPVQNAHRRKSSAYASISYRHGASVDLGSSPYSRVRAITNPGLTRPSDGSSVVITRADTVASSVYDYTADSGQASSAGPSEQSFPGVSGSTGASANSSAGFISISNPTPIVTNLADDSSPLKSPSMLSPRTSDHAASWHLRLPGFRAFSDSSGEKKGSSLTSSLTSSIGLRKSGGARKEEAAAAATATAAALAAASSLPATTNPSPGAGVGAGSSATDSKFSAATSVGGKPASILPRRQNKKGTSAFVHGLLDRTPAEQIEGSDFSGWMMKRSTKLMGNWKSRLFVLRGRRLSYYYSQSDTCEKGLIDISNHQVLPAMDERFVGFHATIAHGQSAHSRNVSGTESSHIDSAIGAVPTIPATSGDNKLFVFKLIPPRTGFTKTVNFTKPTVHYFAVSSLHAGRAWMGALMKANIELVESSVYSTFNHRTIPLKQAQAALANAEARLEATAAAGAAATITAVPSDPEDTVLRDVNTNLPEKHGRVNIDSGMKEMSPYEDRSVSAASTKVDSATSGGGGGIVLGEKRSDMALSGVDKTGPSSYAAAVSA